MTAGIVQALTSVTSIERRNADEALGRALSELTKRCGHDVGIEVWPRSRQVRLTAWVGYLTTTAGCLSICEQGDTLLEAVDRVADRLARGDWS